MKALILAAGEGTRLRPLTFTRQKPMTPVGPEPSIFYLVSHLAKEGFNDIVVIVGGPMKQHLMDYLGDGVRFGVKISYAVKPDEFRSGTAGSLKLVDGLLDEPFLVAQSDTLTEMPLAKAVEFHKGSEATATIVLTEVKDAGDFGVAVVDSNGMITEFQEKPPRGEAKGNLISTGFYILDPECVELIMHEKWDFANGTLPLSSEDPQEDLRIRLRCFLGRHRPTGWIPPRRSLGPAEHAEAGLRELRCHGFHHPRDNRERSSHREGSQDRRPCPD